MLAVDLKEAFDGGKGNWFSVLLLRLIAKSDEENRDKLALGFPAHVRAVWIYKNDCPYVEKGGDVDWNEIARRAEEPV